MSDSTVLLRNPYTPMSAEDTVAQGNFVGRREIWFTELHTRLSQPGHDRHLFIQGRSGIGKTSLLRQIAYHAVNDLNIRKANVLYLDLSEPGLEPLMVAKRIISTLPLDQSTRWTDGLSEAARRLADAFTIQAPLVEGPSLDVGKLLNDRKPDTIASAFDLADRGLHHLIAGSQTLIILDQLGAIAEYAEQAERGAPDEAWRHILKGIGRLLETSFRLDIDRTVRFILAVRMEQTGALLAVASPIFFSSSIDRIESLRALTVDEARELIKRPAERQGFTLLDETVKLLLQQSQYSSFGLPGEVSGTNPLGLQLACWSLWEWLRREGQLAPGIAISVNAQELDIAFASVLGPRLAGFSNDERIVLQIISEYGALAKTRLIELAGVARVKSPVEVISALCEHSLQPVRYVPQNDFYTIAHDILRDYIRNSTPKEEHQFLQAQRLLEDVPRRSRVASPLSIPELDELWYWRNRLSFTSQQLAAVLGSQFGHSRGIERWLKNFPERVVPALTGLAKSGQDESVRITAAYNLGKLGQTQVAIQVLMELAKSGQRRSVRETAVDRLGRLGEAALPALTELAKFEQDEGVCVTAIVGLGRLGEAAFPVLMDLARSEQSDVVRSTAMNHLSRPGVADIPILTELAKSAKSMTVCLSALFTLSKLGEAAIPALTELAKSAQYKAVREFAWDLLSKLGEAAIPMLTELAISTQGECVSRTVMNNLSLLGEAAIPVLMELAKSTLNESVRFTAAELLVVLTANA